MAFTMRKAVIVFQASDERCGPLCPYGSGDECHLHRIDAEGADAEDNGHSITDPTPLRLDGKGYVLRCDACKAAERAAVPEQQP